MSSALLLPAAPARRFSRPFAAGLFAGALILRLALVLLLKDVTEGPTGPSCNDDVEFDHLAKTLVAGAGYLNDHGVPTSFRAPGFPCFLAGLYALFGCAYPLAYVAFCLLGAVNAVLAYCLARELLSEGYARGVGVLTALYLGNLTVSLYFISETLFVPLLTLGAWLFVRFLRRGGFCSLGFAGLVLGYATLTRPFSLLLLPFWGLLLCWHFRRDFRRLVVAGLVYGLPFLAPILPWTYRNYEVHGHVVLIATNGGSTFLGGTNDLVWNNRRFWGYWVGTDQLPERPLIDATPNEYEHDQMEWKLGKDYVRAHPGRAAAMAFLKLGSLWVRPPEMTVGESKVYWLRGLAYYPLLILMFLAFVRCLSTRSLWTPGWAALHLVILATMITAMIFCGLARFRDANVSLLMIYAVVGWDALRGLFSSRRASEQQNADDRRYTSIAANQRR